MEKNILMLLQIKKKRLEALINKDGDHKDEEIFNELVNERFNKVIELTDKISR